LGEIDALFPGKVGHKMIQRNTAVSELVLKAPGYRFTIANECDTPEQSGMLALKLYTIEFRPPESELRSVAWVNDLCDE
jgi:hypothetical protein